MTEQNLTPERENRPGSAFSADFPRLIEFAFPLEDINREAAREKSIRHGHPSTLHLWWARRPLAACRERRRQNREPAQCRANWFDGFTGIWEYGLYENDSGNPG